MPHFNSWRTTVLLFILLFLLPIDALNVAAFCAAIGQPCIVLNNLQKCSAGGDSGAEAEKTSAINPAGLLW